MLYYLVVTQILPLNQHMMLWLYFVRQSFLLYNVSTNVTLKSNIIPITCPYQGCLYSSNWSWSKHYISPPPFLKQSLKLDLWLFTTNLLNVVTSTIPYKAFNIFIRFSFKNLTILVSSFYNCYVFTWLIWFDLLCLTSISTIFQLYNVYI